MISFKVDGKEISRNGDKAFIIAEIGHNHQGDIEICKDLFSEAAKAGAGAVKLQKRFNKDLYTTEMYNSPYTSENAYAPTYGKHREYLEFGKKEYLELKAFAESKGLVFLSTAFDFKSVDFLEEINVSAHKIASGDLPNIPLIKYIAKCGKPVFISTGGACFKDVQRAYNAIKPINKNICIMQCTAGYPAKTSELNLKVIQTYLKEFPDIVVGLSDHHQSILPSTLGYMLGARVFEKHFTLSRSWKGSDQAFSLEPMGLYRIVRDLSLIPIELGDGVKIVFDSEKEPIRKMGKMIVASRNLKKGHIIGEKDVNFKSPCEGLSPYMLEDILGSKLKNDIKKEQPLKMEYLDRGDI